MCIVRGSDPTGRKGTTTVKTGQRRPPAAPMENLCAEDRVQIVAEKAPLVGRVSAPLRILSACPVAARCGQSSWQKTACGSPAPPYAGPLPGRCREVERVYRGWGSASIPVFFRPEHDLQGFERQSDVRVFQHQSPHVRDIGAQSSFQSGVGNLRLEYKRIAQNAPFYRSPRPRFRAFFAF
jgi:hypothetical protein